MIPFPISPLLYQRGAGGVPSTSIALRDVRPTLESYTHSIVATGGFESCALTFGGGLDDVIYWTKNLMASAIVYAPSAEVIWEGYLAGVQAQLGQEEVDLSLDDMANAVSVYYTPPPPAAPASTGFATVAASVSSYGRKERALRQSNMTSAQAAALQNTLLTERGYPVARRSSTVATGELGGISITLNLAGWYTTLDWLTTSSTTPATAAPESIIPTLVTAYNGVNNYFPATYWNAAGVSSTQQIPAGTTYRAAIEALLATGTNANQRWTWGVYEGRAFRAGTWAGATPTVPTYIRRLGDGRVYSAGGPVVPWWEVRPDAMYQVPELIDYAPNPVADSAARYYVERVTCSVSSSGVSLRLEPSKSTDFDVLLARVR